MRYPLTPSELEAAVSYTMRRDSARWLQYVRVLVARESVPSLRRAPGSTRWADYLVALNGRHARLDARDRVEWRGPVRPASTRPADVWPSRSER